VAVDCCAAMVLSVMSMVGSTALAHNKSVTVTCCIGFLSGSEARSVVSVGVANCCVAS
jgi:hypothetical protein